MALQIADEAKVDGEKQGGDISVKARKSFNPKSQSMHMFGFFSRSM